MTLVKACGHIRAITCRSGNFCRYTLFNRIWPSDAIGNCSLVCFLLVKIGEGQIFVDI